MRVLARIGDNGNSKKVIVKGIKKVVNGRIFANCVLGYDDDAKYYKLLKQNASHDVELVPRQETIYLVESGIEDCTYIEANGYTQSCVHLGGDKFMMFERVKLWDNTIIGLNCLSHSEVGTYGSTIFKIGETAKNVTYYKTMSRDEFMKKYNNVDLLEEKATK